jgi:subtilisin family serine protease
MAGQLPAESYSNRKAQINPLVLDRSYRSRTSSHKVVVHKNEEELRQSILADGGSVIEEYGAFCLMSAPAATAEAATVETNWGGAVRDDMNVILLRAGAFDTTEGEPAIDVSLAESSPAGEQLYLVQMVGPVKEAWHNQLEAAAQIVSYVPNNAFLVRASSAGLVEINNLQKSGVVQWSGPFRPGYKIAPEIALNSDQEILTTVQLVTTAHTPADIETLSLLSGAPLAGEPEAVLGYTNIRLKIHTSRLVDVARMNDVVWIEPWSEPELLDERQGLIVAGLYTGNQLAGPGYLNWLRSKNLDSTPDFLVDVSDSGIDQGVLDPAVIHKDFLNLAGAARVVYARLLGSGIEDGPTNDIGGHGTLNAGIVGGYNLGGAFPYVDSQGYSFGLGVHPFVKIGVTKLFNPEFTDPNRIDMVDQMYRDGARVSSNSWGAYNNSYTVESQLYDSLVRDARRGEPGNQELTVVFASGNKGPGGNLSIPATAKNVITVGASENMRPTGVDGCGITSEGADEILSMIRFSSGGPATDGRIKPDVVAPGTHVQAAQSQDPNFTAGGVCGPRNFPSGQTLYTWSSGTSHSTPAVAGAAALVRQFFQQSTGRAPSPAMIKAFLTNSTTYMTGYLAGDNLPGPNQGWGLLNLGRALDGVQRNMIDQTQILGSTGEELTLRGTIADPSKPFRVTLAWTDAPGTPSANPTVNDLDLQVTAGGKTYFGNRFSGATSVEGGPADRLNNIESVWLPEGLTGEYTVRVIAAGIAGDGVPGNGDTTDQDFALVVYNALGAGGGGPLDTPPNVTTRYPAGGERFLAGSTMSITWDASDDKGIQSQRVEFSSDGGVTYAVIATLDGSVRKFDWKIPAVPTSRARIRITALDGVNLPATSVTPLNFEVVIGPPDTTPPTVALVSPAGDSVIGGGTTATIKWRENDNVGVTRRVIELSTDAGRTFQEVASISAPGGTEQQSFDWQVPVALSTTAGKIRITVFDGADNSSSVISSGKFDVWPLPIVTDANFLLGGENQKNELEVFGRHFRIDETNIRVNGRRLRKIRFNEKCDSVDGTCKKVSSLDRKLHKFVPEGERVVIQVELPRTGQMSPAFEWKRKRPRSS